MTTYRVNDAGVAKARELIDAHQYDLHTSWSEGAPSAESGRSHPRQGPGGPERPHDAIIEAADELLAHLDDVRGAAD